MADTETVAADSQAPKGKGRSKRSAIQAEVSHILVCLPETEALLALSGGAIVPSLNVWQDGAEMPYWVDGVPAAQLTESRGLVSDSGELFIFTVDATSVERSGVATGLVRLPISLSKVSAVSVRSSGYRDQMLARVSDFADLVLDAVDLRVEPRLFASVSTELPVLVELSRTRESGVDHRPEKCAGAVAGVLAAIDCGILKTERTEAVWNAIGSVAGGEDADAQLGLALGSALSGESVDELSAEIVRAILQKLRSLTARDGIEPSLFLDAIATEVRAKARLTDLAGLDRFLSAAIPLVSMHPSGNRELLQDGGAIMLRGVTAFLRSPSVEKLAATSLRGGRIGYRVASFAMFLAGYYEGVFSLSRRIKASSKSRLFGLGQLAEAIGSGVPIMSRTSVSIEGGVALRTLHLFGHEVQRSEVEVPVGYVHLASAANEAGLRMSVATDGLTLVVKRDAIAFELFAGRFSPEFLVPPQDLVRLTLLIALPKNSSARAHLSEAIRRAGLIEEPRDDVAIIAASILLSEAITGAVLQRAIDRLLEFRSTHSPSVSTPANLVRSPRTSVSVPC